MSRRSLLTRLGGVLLCAGILLTAVPNISGQSVSGPFFSTGEPVLGSVDNAVIVFLPLANTGASAATNVEVISATLGNAQLISPLLPFELGTMPNAKVSTLSLRFDASSLVPGNKYLVTVRGDYQSNATALGFAVNRIFTYQPNVAGLTEGEVVALVGAKYASLPQVNQDDDNQALLTYVLSLPEVANAHIPSGGGAVLGAFTSGRTFSIINNQGLPPPPQGHSVPAGASRREHANVLHSIESTGPQPARSDSFPAVAVGDPVELPTSSNARILGSLDPDWENWNPVPDLQEWLVTEQFYDDSPPMGHDATLEGLRNVGGDGVFYITAHGGGDPEDPTWPYHITTATSGIDVPDELTQADLDAQPPRLVIGLSAGIWNPLIKKWELVPHYGITAAFIKTNWHRFGPNSLVYVDACSSAAPMAQEFEDAILKLGASVYVGWTDDALGGMQFNTAEFVFDRLLGANHVFPEADGFKQRPFNYGSIENNLSSHGLGRSGNATIKFIPNPEPGQGNFGILAPSIGYTWVDEPNNQLYMFGFFGSDPRPDGSVSVGGEPAGIVTWDPEEIVATVPASGAGAVGDEIVIARAHKSNVARLTEWEGTFRFTVQGEETLKQTIYFNLGFRADIRQYRAVIGQPLLEPDIGPSGALDGSTASYQCTGNHVVSVPGVSTTTYTWQKSGDLVLWRGYPDAILFPAPALNWFGSIGELASHTSMLLQVSADSSSNFTPCNQHTKTVVVDPLGTFSSDFPFSLCAGASDLNLTLDESATIQQGSQSFPDVCSIGFVQAVGFDWGPIFATNGTAPDPNSAR